jgi:hypothetical protein
MLISWTWEIKSLTVERFRFYYLPLVLFKVQSVHVQVVFATQVSAEQVHLMLEDDAAMVTERFWLGDTCAFQMLPRRVLNILSLLRYKFSKLRQINSPDIIHGPQVHIDSAHDI